jgi:hypothetical protein
MVFTASTIAKKAKLGGGIPRSKVKDPALQRQLDSMAEAIEKLTSQRGKKDLNEVVTFQDLQDNGFSVGLDPSLYPASVETYSGSGSPIIKVPTTAAATVYQFTEYFESTGIPPTVGHYVATPQAHGLTGRPTLLTMHLRCIATDNGYSVDDEAQIIVFTWNGSEYTTIWADATYVGLSQSDRPNIRHKTLNSQFNPSATYWTMIIRAWR